MSLIDVLCRKKADEVLNHLTKSQTSLDKANTHLQELKQAKTNLDSTINELTKLLVV